ncbi:MAG: FAD-dependent oxidoreductase, partial [Clostridiales bacterium]|nr:FAD-dependent oxidoreductase [Clostridiales bacterium]
FISSYVPGFEQSALVSTGPKIGVRGSRQLIGRYRLTQDDVLSARRFESAIAHCGYPVDIHNPLGEGTQTRDIASSAGRSYYDIPYEVMLSSTLDNLLVTGRCISADFSAQASMRVTPVAGSLGQAAGTAAYLAAKKGGMACDVDICELQGLLRKNKAYIEE